MADGNWELWQLTAGRDMEMAWAPKAFRTGTLWPYIPLLQSVPRYSSHTAICTKSQFFIKSAAHCVLLCECFCMLLLANQPISDVPSSFGTMSASVHYWWTCSAELFFDAPDFFCRFVALSVSARMAVGCLDPLGRGGQSSEFPLGPLPP
jgi:hypothetical protein